MTGKKDTSWQAGSCCCDEGSVDDEKIRQLMEECSCEKGTIDTEAIMQKMRKYCSEKGSDPDSDPKKFLQDMCCPEPENSGKE